MNFFKFKILKRFAKTNRSWNNWKIRIDNKTYDLDVHQKNAIALWNLCLNDKEAQLYCSFLTLKRQIEKEFLLITLISKGGRHNEMTIIDLTNGNHNCFNIAFNEKVEDIVLDLKDDFDTEMERRVRSIEFSKKEIMRKDLESLVLIQSKNIQEQQIELSGKNTAHI